MAELKEVGRQLSEHWRPFDPMAPPPCIAIATSSHREKPDVWLEPSKSKIVQIRAAEIVSSARWVGQGEGRLVTWATGGFMSTGVSP